MYHPRLKGTHYEMGFHYGDILLKSGEDLRDVIKLNKEQTMFGRNSLKIYENYAPDLMEEVKGLSDGLKIRYEDLAYWLISIYCFDDHGCSCFALHKDGITYFARNMDMPPEYKKTSESVLYRANNKNIILGHSTSMVLLEDGINEHGLAVGITFLYPKEIKPGLNAGFIVRLLLEECKNTDDAIKLLKSIPISSTQNIIIADKTGDMVVVECSCNDLVIRKNKNYVIATNHFIEKNMLKNNNIEENWFHTNERYQSIEKSLQLSNLNFETIKDILSGKNGFVCQYEKKLNFDTIWSVVYNLNDLYNEIAEGNPSRIGYKYDNRLEWGLKNRK